jgi:uncharacterized protein (DUF433 family)
MKPFSHYEYLKVSDLQKMTGGKLKKLARRPVIITERSRPKYMIVPADSNVGRDREYQYLTARPHPWKKQLFIKGRNMTAANLVYTMRKEKMTVEEAAKDFNLPMDAVLEALHYLEHNRPLIELEVLEEKRRLADRGLLRAA